MSIESLLSPSNASLVSVHAKVAEGQGEHLPSPHKVEAMEARGGRETVDARKHEVALNSAESKQPLRQPNAPRPESSDRPAQVLHAGLEFIQDEETGQTFIEIYDRETGAFIRRIPPEDSLTFLEQLAMHEGPFVSKRL